MFDAARLLSRCNGRGVLVFIDEVDALASRRTGNDDKMARRLAPRPAATGLMQRMGLVLPSKIMFMLYLPRMGSLKPGIMHDSSCQ